MDLFLDSLLFHWSVCLSYAIAIQFLFFSSLVFYWINFFWPLLLFFKKDYLFMRHRESEAETQAEGEAGSLGGARYRTWSQDPRITPEWKEGRCSTAEHPRCPFLISKTIWSENFHAVEYSLICVQFSESQGITAPIKILVLSLMSLVCLTVNLLPTSCHKHLLIPVRSV